MKVIPFTVFPFKPIVIYNEHERKTSDAESGICFSRAIRERAACEAGGRARQRGLVIEGEHTSTKEKQATLKAAVVFLVPLENEQPAKQAEERASAGS